MTNYPEIHRRDGRLFFTIDVTDRVTIATSVERLIDLLDAYEGDPDLEPYLAESYGDDREGDYGFSLGGDADFEPSLGAPEQVQQSHWYHIDTTFHVDLEQDNSDWEESGDAEPSLGSSNDYNGGSQHFWGHGGVADEREAENEHGGDILDEPHDGQEDDEPELGWTCNIDQSVAVIVHRGGVIEDGEPWLGWSGEGIGFIAAYSRDDREADDTDPRSITHTFAWDGTGYSIGADMLAKVPAENFREGNRYLGQRLADGGIFTLSLPSRRTSSWHM